MRDSLCELTKREPPRTVCAAFPDRQDSPTSFGERIVYLGIVSRAAFDLFSPEVYIALRPLESWAMMPVPETPMYLDNRFVFWNFRYRTPDFFWLYSLFYPAGKKYV